MPPKPASVPPEDGGRLCQRGRLAAARDSEPPQVNRLLAPDRQGGQCWQQGCMTATWELASVPLKTASVPPGDRGRCCRQGRPAAVTRDSKPQRVNPAPAQDHKEGP